MLHRLIFALGITLLNASLLVAQNTTGKIVGTVSAADGAVAGATVTVTDDQTGKERTVTSNSEGTFEVPQLEFGSYSVKIAATGFKTFVATKVKIDAGREYQLNAQLEVGQIVEQVVVTAGGEPINASNAELSMTISREQIRELPLNGRNPLALVTLTPGAGPTTNAINGQRSSSQAITRDGLNVQDNFIRTGAFVDDRPTVDDIAEFTITTQNAGAELGGGASLVQLVTPRGGSEFHGNLYEFNRNSKFAANNFFNNATPDAQGNAIPKPFLNRNEFGGSISGPSPIFRFGEGGPALVRNKAFFFFNYEGFRLAQQVSAAATTLLPQARTGNFTFIDTITGQTRTINVLTGSGFTTPVTAAQGGVLTVDPIIQSRILDQLPTTGNGLTTGINLTQVLNFNRSNPVTRNQWVARYDIQFNDRNSVNVVYKRKNETNSRTDIASGFSTVPFVNQTDPTHFMSAAYAWTGSANFSNEVRGGFQFTNPFFNQSHIPPDFFIGLLPLSITHPEGTFTDQGRDTKYYNLQDNAVYSFGNHSFRFGGQIEWQKLQSVVNFGVLPTYNISTTGNQFTPGLTAGQIGGINTTDLARANSLRYLLGGVIGTANQTFNLIDPQTGYASTSDVQPLDYQIYSAYFADQWRLRPNFTLNLGLRYDYYTPLHSPIGNYLEPVIQNGDLVGSILNPDGFLNIIGGNSGRQGTFTKPDRNNFGPNVSFAYSPMVHTGFLSRILSDSFVVRGGFRVNYVNDEYVKSTSTLLGGNPGLRSFTSTTVNGLNNFRAALTPRGIFGAIPTFPVPGFTPPPLSFEQNNINQGGAQMFGVDPNLQVQREYEYNFGIQRNLGFNTVLEVRYVGGYSNDLIQTTTFNQLDIRSTGFLSDFRKAQQNCRLQGATRPGAATAFDTMFLCTDARFNPAIPGSQPLNVFSGLVSGGFLNDTGTILPLIQAGRAGSLAQFYFLNGLNGSVPIVTNPNIFIDEILTNSGRFRYNALQAEVRRRFNNGISVQANYTFQKTLTDIPVEDQNRQGEVQDNNNPNLNYSRPDYDRTHTFNFNGIYELPFGRGKRFLNGGGWAQHIFGGLQATSVISLVSGPPIGVIDPRSTSTITFQSGRQSATTSLTIPELRKLTGIFNTPNGIYYFDPKILCATATAPGRPTLSCFDLNQQLPAGYTLASVRAASPLGQAPFPGQVFFFNEAGSTGNMQRNALNGMPYFNWDAGFSKNIRLGENRRLQFRVEAFNLLNHQVPFFGTTSAYTAARLDVNSNSFGRVTQIYNTPRIIQFGARFDF